jgi:outer membrane putative beta-barrel porin/alpha-amylase
MRIRALAFVMVVFAVGTSPTPAAAQQTVSEVLSFLLTNRSIPTGDFVQDARAAAATRDTISTFLLLELSELPVTSSASAFTYRLDRNLGTVVRSSDSFGPFLVERSLTSGLLRGSLALTYQTASFDTIDGRSLRDGTLVATASRLRGDAQPFDVESVSLEMHTNTMTLLGNIGVTDRLDIGAALPFVAISMDGRRVDTYRGSQLVQAIASASASGPGDFLIRGKYNVVRGAGSGLAIGAEARLPTGNEQNLLGTGEASIKPRVIASLERDRVAFHGDVGYSIGGLSDELVYGGAVTVLGTSRLTLVAEIAGRRLSSAGRLTETTEPHPSLAGVETIRLTSIDRATERVAGVIGFKWNIAATLLFSANVVKPFTSAGLNARWISTFALDYSFEP